VKVSAKAGGRLPDPAGREYDAAMRRNPDLAENQEQATETAQERHALSAAQLADVSRQASELMERLAAVPQGDLVAEMIETSLKLLRDRTNRGDLKLINKSIKEIRYALKVFAPYQHTRKVSIFGSARTPENDPDYEQAVRFGRKMAQHGWMVITGSGGGIMAAGHGGAGADPSFGLAIRLPFEQATNVHIANDPKLINFKYFFTRKLMFLRSSHAIALFPGGFGTMDEGFEALTLVQTGKAPPMPIVLVDRPGGNFWKGWMAYVKRHLLGRKFINEEDVHLVRITDDVDEAVEHTVRFYSNYHSLRYARDELVLRVQRGPTPAQLQRLNDDFADLVEGRIRAGGPLAVEKDEPSLAHLPRLVMKFNRRDFARLRALIDRVNDF